jgi:hypothetical protein
MRKSISLRESPGRGEFKGVRRDLTAVRWTFQGLSWGPEVVRVGLSACATPLGMDLPRCDDSSSSRHSQMLRLCFQSHNCLLTIPSLNLYKYIPAVYRLFVAPRMPRNPPSKDSGPCICLLRMANSAAKHDFDANMRSSLKNPHPQMGI